jgi:hypothetical protein
MKRLFIPSTKFPVYNNAVDRYMVESDILNGGNMKPNIHTVIMVRENMQGLLIELEGDNDGVFIRDGNYERAAIPFIKTKIREIENKFTDYQDQQVKEGYEMSEVMPIQMLNEYYEHQARLTVRQAEADELRRRLQVYKDREQKEADSTFLQYGLRGIAHFWGFEAPDKSMINVLKEIDGQRITQTSDGLLIINDPRSPWSGISVCDYRVLVKAFFESERQRENEQLKKVQEQCKADGKAIPNHLGAHGMRKIRRESLPKWPEGVKNWLAKDETPKMIRVRKK